MCTRREAVKLTCWPSAGDFGGTVGHQPETLGHQPETLVGLLAPCWPQTYLGIGPSAGDFGGTVGRKQIWGLAIIVPVKCPQKL